MIHGSDIIVLLLTLYGLRPLINIAQKGLLDVVWLKIRWLLPSNLEPHLPTKDLPVMSSHYICNSFRRYNSIIMYTCTKQHESQ